MGGMIKKKIGDEYQGMKIVYSQEPEPLGTAGALRFALPHLNTICALVMNGDSYCEFDFSAFNVAHSANNAEATILLVKRENAARYGTVVTSDNGVVKRFLEKNGAKEPGWINAGVYLIDRGLIAEIPEGKKLSIETDIFPSWADGRLFGFKGTGGFIDIGTPESYNAANHFKSLEVNDE
jgi:NDP-sugar pyrophosphorylase family protein